MLKKHFICITRSTQRAQTSLAEADHYSHMPTVKMLSLVGERLTPPSPTFRKTKFWIITCTTIWLCYRYYGVFFAHLLILEYSDHHQNLISSSLYYPGPLHKISLQSVHNFLSNVVHRQTNQRYQKHNLLCQGGNKSSDYMASDFYQCLFMLTPERTN